MSPCKQSGQAAAGGPRPEEPAAVAGPVLPSRSNRTARSCWSTRIFNEMRAACVCCSELLIAPGGKFTTTLSTSAHGVQHAEYQQRS